MAITVKMFKQRFPEFADTTDALVAFALEEANFFTGTWTKPGRDLALLYLSAHIIATNAYAAENDGLTVESERIARLEIRYRSAGKDIVLGDPGSTVYGRRYQQIQGRNIKSFEVIHQRHSAPAPFDNPCFDSDGDGF